MSTMSELTPTSYALLGLLNVRSWTTYELAQQMDRTLGRFWPRARSKLYEEPKKLVAPGLARTTNERVGRRPRSVYSITAKGRRALAAWLAVEADGPVLESEQVLKAFFADGGTSTDLLHTLHDVRAWVSDQTVNHAAVGRAYLEGEPLFPERAAINSILGRFLETYLEGLDRWAEWATGVVEAWPERPVDAELDRTALEATVRQAERRIERWRRAADRHRRPAED
jgi:PadR family transcriptional regulator, regulatory protein AphA